MAVFGVGKADFGVEFRPGELNSLQRWFRLAPKQMKKALRKAWTKERRRMVKSIKQSQLSGPTGPRTLARSRGRVIHTRTLKPRIHLREALGRHKKGIGLKGTERFGAYIRIKYAKDVRYIGRFHEFGTKHLAARAPLETGWEKVDDRIWPITLRTIDQVMESL